MFALFKFKNRLSNLNWFLIQIAFDTHDLVDLALVVVVDVRLAVRERDLAERERERARPHVRLEWYAFWRKLAQAHGRHGGRVAQTFERVVQLVGVGTTLWVQIMMVMMIHDPYEGDGGGRGGIGVLESKQTKKQSRTGH